MRLAFCTDGIFPEAVGGMQRHSKLLLEELAQKEGISIDVFHPHNKVIFPEHASIKEIFVKPTEEKRNYLKECYAYSKRIYSHLSSGNYDVIYSQGLSVWHKCEEFSDRLVVNPHGLEPFQAIGFKDKLIAIPFKKGV